MTLEMKIILFLVAVFFLLGQFVLSFRRKKFVRLLGFTGAVYGVVYIVWRVFYTLPSYRSVGFVFGLLLVVFEILALGQSLVFKMFFSSDRKYQINKDTPFSELPSVDVIISTYNEPVDLLERTLVSCVQIDYPKEKINIYIGDDGRRHEVKTIAEKYNVNYITRPDNSHAKAGNINNVLKQSKGEFVLVLDADMIPKNEIVKKMIGYFEDSQTGFVQSPQVFYNLDPFQYNLDVGDTIPNEQDFFMRTVQEKRSLFNAVLHVGTNAIFRRSALEQIGGIPTGSITEDMATGMLIQNEGYKSYFVKDTLAVGLSVESIEDLIRQRDRWLRGNVQVIKKYNPLKMRGLSWIQKIIYMDGFVYWMFGVQKMVYIVAPLLYLLLRLTIFRADGLDIAFMFLPYFISNSLYFRRVSDRGRNVTWSHIYDTAIAPQMAVSFLTEFFIGKDIPFNVTPKGVVNHSDVFRTRLAATHLLIFALSVFAFLINVSMIFSGNIYGILSAVLINLFWCVYNGLGIFVSVFIYLDRKRFRRSERILTNLKVQALIDSCSHNDNCTHCGHVLDISENGTKIKIKEHCPYFTYETDSWITLRIDDVGIVSGKVVRVDKFEDTYEMGVRFDSVNFETFVAINRFRFDLKHKYINDSEIDEDMDSFIEIIYKLSRRWKYRLLPSFRQKQKSKKDKIAEEAE